MAVPSLMLWCVKGIPLSKFLEPLPNDTVDVYAGVGSLIPKTHMRLLKPCYVSVKRCRSISKWMKRKRLVYFTSVAIATYGSAPQKSIEYGLYRYDWSSNSQPT